MSVCVFLSFSSVGVIVITSQGRNKDMEDVIHAVIPLLCLSPFIVG